MLKKKLTFNDQVFLCRKIVIIILITLRKTITMIIVNTDEFWSFKVSNLCFNIGINKRRNTINIRFWPKTSNAFLFHKQQQNRNKSSLKLAESYLQRFIEIYPKYWDVNLKEIESKYLFTTEMVSICQNLIQSRTVNGMKTTIEWCCWKKAKSIAIFKRFDK